MKQSIGVWYEVRLGLSNILQKDIPIRAAFRLSRLASKLKAELDIADEKRVELIKKHGKPVEGEPEKFKFPTDEAAKAFQDEFKLITDEQIEVDFEPLLIAELGDVNVATADIMLLGTIIKES